MTLANLGEVVAALKAGAVTAYLDNDCVTFMRGDDELLELHPHEVQQQALALLGIETEEV